MPPRQSLARRLSTSGGPDLVTLLSVLQSPSASSTSLPRALSSAFPSPSDSFPLRTLTNLLPLLPSPLLSLRFLLWRLPPTSPLPSSHTLSSFAATLPELPSSVPLLLSSSPQPLALRHYALLLSISAHAGVFPASLAVLRHMRSFGLTPDVACFLSALRAAGSPADVSAVLDIMSVSGISPSVPLVVTTVHKLASAGDFESARRLIDKMPEFGCVPSAVVYTAMLDGMCSFGDVGAAAGLLEEMEGDCLGAGCAPNVVSYTCLVKCLCGKRRMGEALGVLDRMTGRGVIPNRVFVRTLVEGFCSEGMVADAYAAVERVVSDGSLSSEQCYNVLLICLWRVRMDGEAEELMQRMMKNGVQLSPLAGSVMVKELCARNRLLDACYWLGVMEENGVLCNTDVYTGLLSRLCVEGHVLEALALARKVAERGIRIEASCADCLMELLKEYAQRPEKRHRHQDKDEARPAASECSEVIGGARSRAAEIEVSESSCVGSVLESDLAWPEQLADDAEATEYSSAREDLTLSQAEEEGKRFEDLKLDEEESYERFRRRERRGVVARDYTDVYSSMPGSYGRAVVEQRVVMVNWIIEHSQVMKLQPETVFMGIGLMDRFLTRGYLKGSRNLQLLGIACTTLATRIEENQPYNCILQKAFKVGINTFSRCEVVAMEWLVLEVLNFQCFVTTTHHFLWFYLKAAKADGKVEDMAKYLALLSLLDHKPLSYWPSTVAAAVVALACLATDNESSCHLVMETHMRTKTICLNA
ncbi:hypothetical protein ABZP36_018558 [Zizania latifolia]